MKKWMALLLTTLLVLSALPALADTASVSEWAKTEADKLDESARVVNIFTWTYYVPDEVVADFEAATGIRVNYSPFLDNDDVAAKLSTNPGQYDIVVCSDYMIAELIEQSLLSEIDSAKIPNYANIDSTYQNPYYDPDNTYTIPYTNTIPLIVYDPEKIDFEVTGFKDLWREEFKGGLATIAEWRNVIGMTQKKLGLSFNETDPDKMAPVLDEMKALKANIAVMNDDTPHNALISGDAIAGYMFGSQIVAAREVMPQLEVVYPEEGMNFGIDCFIMPLDAPHADATYIFLNYMLDGEVNAYASDLIDYGNCNAAAPEYMTDEYKNETSVNIPSDKLTDAEMIMPLDNDTLDIYDAIWTEFMQYNP